MNYIHKHTGEIATEQEWKDSYDVEELEIRGLTIEEAWNQDLYETFFEEEEE